MSYNQNEQFLGEKFEEQPVGIKKHRCIFRILKLSLVFNVLLIVALLVVYIRRSHNFNKPRQNDQVMKEEVIHLLQNGNSTEQNEDKVCIPCDYFGDDVAAVDTLYDVILKTKCNHKLCCFEKQKDIIRFLLKALQTERDPHTLSFPDDNSEFDWWTGRPYSAHLTKDLGSKELKWKTESSKEMAFIKDLVLQNNSIAIPARGSGLYFLYTVVTQDFSQFDTVPYSYHAINKINPYILDRYNNPRKDLLIMNKYGGTAVQSRLHTSPLRGVFKLNEGDIVEVTLKSDDEHSFLHNKLFSNFFGVLKL